jgi:hypothetical protein
METFKNAKTQGKNFQQDYLNFVVYQEICRIIAGIKQVNY